MGSNTMSSSAPASAAPAASSAASRNTFSATQFAVVVCRHPNGKFLAVKKRGKGWWMPGGFVEVKENFFKTAHAKTAAEAGIKIKLEGILRVEYTPLSDNQFRMRLVFYATPVDVDAVPKPEDPELCEDARWVTLEELAKLSESDGLRGPELIGWGTYVQNGGEILPLQIIAPENAPIPIKKPSA
eukprot:c15943_g1_i1.p1 GENE.c15943_g1_i1~~c15943_g1_i1.p1  ORF type:complete len:185 (+),score=40.40 c15943_g1_i1:1-555(+)